MNKTNSANALFKAIDKMLNYSLPTQVTSLKIELDFEKPPLITVQYIPQVSESLESDYMGYIGQEIVTKEFNVVPVKGKRKR